MKWGILFLSMLCIAQSGKGQEPAENQLLPPPPFQTERAGEQYGYLKDKGKNPYEKGLWDGLKFIPLNEDGHFYLTLGGEFRPRLEIYTNRNWTSEDETFYSQRLNFHTQIHLGQYVRIYGEIYHGYTSNARQLTQDDQIDLHQAFVEFKTPLSAEGRLAVRLGRQEMGLGAGRLADLRDGPNIRRSFDMARLIYQRKNGSIQAFYGKEVLVGFKAFDNKFSLFDNDASNAELWGVYGSFSFNDQRSIEIYYLGFQSKFSAYSDVAGAESRHSFGLRSFGMVGKKWKYNTEVIYQLGTIGDSDIGAFNIETDWHYIFAGAKWKPTLGLKFDWSSGDKAIGDGRLRTFNPMFVNPAIYSLAGLNTPVNLLSIHPSITVYPRQNFMVNLEYALLFRASVADGLYGPPRFQTRMANEKADRHLGDVIGLLLFYAHNRNLSFNLRGSYFISGGFLEETGDSESTFQIAPTANFKF